MPSNPRLTSPLTVYQDLLLQRLRASHGGHLDQRINWVMTSSGPLQCPTYTVLFYFDSAEIARGSGPTRDTAKESAAARALTRLPPPRPFHESKEERREQLALGHSNAPPGQNTTWSGVPRAERRTAAAADGVQTSDRPSAMLSSRSSQFQFRRITSSADSVSGWRTRLFVRSDSGKGVKTTVHDRV